MTELIGVVGWLVGAWGMGIAFGLLFQSYRRFMEQV